MSELHVYADLEKQQNALIQRSAIGSVEENARLAALAKPFISAWQTALATQSKLEFIRNSHVWTLSLNNVSDWHIQVSNTTPWFFQIVIHASGVTFDIEKPKALSLLHKAVAIKVAETSVAYATHVSIEVIFSLLSHMWRVRTLMPVQADDLLVFSAEWTRQISIASMGHYKLEKDRAPQSTAAAAAEEPDTKRAKK